MQTHITTINPFNNAELASYLIDSSETISDKMQRSNTAFLSWKELPLAERAKHLQDIADYLLSNKLELATMATLEMGKPIAQSIVEVEKCALGLRYYAENAAKYLTPEIIKTEFSNSYVTFQPLGTVLAIMPWNFPYWQVFRAMGAILISGNTMVLKHASNVTGCALNIEQLVKKAGLPEGVMQTLVIPAKEVEQVIAHKQIAAVTFTGSTDAGAKVAAIAGKYLKKQVLELGGNDAYIVLADADIDYAAATCVQSRLNNTGQSCISAKRFIVVEKIAAAFIEKVTLLMQAKIFGEPLAHNTDLGTLARKDLRDELHQQVSKSIAMGAKVLCGGFIPEHEGAFYPATVLVNVQKGMPAYSEELFGPVASIIVAKDENEAIFIANDTDYGLGAAIFSKNIERAEKLAAQYIHAGSVFVNNFVRSDPRMPFGGIKQSGYGRELSIYGMREFVNIKTVVIN